ncbi:hypothetical protein, partial [Bremerella alba]|uniref:hypothetical protein n=1 Tax=Bremerella alba TaxID=980252 RepID=UPI001A9551B1
LVLEKRYRLTSTRINWMTAPSGRTAAMRTFACSIAPATRSPTPIMPAAAILTPATVAIQC